MSPPSRRIPVEAISWKWVTAFFALGSSMLIVGPAFSGDYLQSIVTNVGTGLMLFGILGVCERRLFTIVENASVRPRTIEEAQAEVRTMLSRQDSSHEGESAQDRLRRSLARVGSQLEGAGFLPVRPADGDRHLTYRDGFGSAARWTMHYADLELWHEITLLDGTVVRSETLRVLASDSAAEQMSRFERFESYVFGGLCSIAAQSGLR